MVNGIWYNSVFMGDYTVDLDNQMRMYQALQSTPYFETKTPAEKKVLAQIQELWSKYGKSYYVNEELNSTSGFMKPQYWDSTKDTFVADQFENKDGTFFTNIGSDISKRFYNKLKSP